MAGHSRVADRITVRERTLLLKAIGSTRPDADLRIPDLTVVRRTVNVRAKARPTAQGRVRAVSSGRLRSQHEALAPREVRLVYQRSARMTLEDRRIVTRTRLPSLMRSSTALILSSPEYINHLLIVQAFVLRSTSPDCLELNSKRATGPTCVTRRSLETLSACLPSSAERPGRTRRRCRTRAAR